MTEIKISVSVTLRLYFVNHSGAMPVQPPEHFAIYAWTTHYRTPGFASKAIPGEPTAACLTEHESNKEDLNREAKS